MTPPELIWFNGSIIPMADARISPEDRGYQFADGVYEVIRVYNGVAFTLAEHMQRLERSAGGIEIPLPFPTLKLASEIQQLVQRTRSSEGSIYLQLTRGVAPRNHAHPKSAVPTLLFYVRPLSPYRVLGERDGQKLLTVSDERWKRCFIKSIALLPNVLAKNQALDAGADEAAFVEDGLVSECSASNLFAVFEQTLVTAPVGPKVLPGITSLVLRGLARDMGIEVVERHMRLEEAKAADELFITSTIRELHWVGTWDGAMVAGGKCGPLTRRLREAFRAKVMQDTRQTHPV